MFLIQKLLNKIIYRHFCLLTHVWLSKLFRKQIYQ